MLLNYVINNAKPMYKIANKIYKSNVLLAHLSQRLIDELIVYTWSGVRRRRPSVAHNAQTSSSQKPLGKTKYYVEPPWVGRTKFCSRHVGHMTKMAAMPIYGKNPSKSSSMAPLDRFQRNFVCSIGNSSPS